MTAPASYPGRTLSRGSSGLAGGDLRCVLQDTIDRHRSHVGHAPRAARSTEPRLGAFPRVGYLPWRRESDDCNAGDRWVRGWFGLPEPTVHALKKPSRFEIAASIA